MVALASRAPARSLSRERQLGWLVAAAGVLIAGIVLRLALAGGGVGARSGALMTALLALGTWVAAVVLSSPRSACLVLVGAVALLDLGALTPRGLPEYDDVQALYNTDVRLTAERVDVDAAAGSLVLLVEPRFQGSRAPYGLAADIAGTEVQWDCAFGPGMQRVALPLPTSMPPQSAANVQLRLTGAPNRETDYVLVYSSAARGGFVMGHGDAAQATTCALQ